MAERPIFFFGVLLLSLFIWAETAQISAVNLQGEDFLSETLHPTESSYRLMIARKNLDMINRHNAKDDKHVTLRPYPQFISLTRDEVAARYLNLRSKGSRLRESDIQVITPDNLSLLKSQRSKTVGLSFSQDLSSYSPTVFNQGVCGNCYAYSVTEGININNFVRDRNISARSVQHLTDCSGSYYNLGCNGGYIANSYVYARNIGLYSSQKYPISSAALTTGLTPACRTDITGQVPVRITQAYRMPSESNCYYHMRYIYYGYAMTTSMAASSDNFMYYGSGILRASDCDDYAVNHAVLMVGVNYKSNSNNNYIKFKNSWGYNWGENGYFRIEPSSSAFLICQDTVFSV